VIELPGRGVRDGRNMEKWRVRVKGRVRVRVRVQG